MGIGVMILVLYVFQDADMYSDRHALIVPSSTGLGSVVYPVSFSDSSAPIICVTDKFNLNAIGFI